MRFEKLPLAGAYRVTMEPIEDDRGFFARSFCAEAFRQRGLPDVFVQCNVSRNRLAGTLRGLHFQQPPDQQGKLVRCTRGAIFDVLVDLRHDSPTLLRWHAEEITEDNHRSIYIPPGFAHGFQTLLPDSDVFYQMTTAFRPGAGGGIRYDDPQIGVDWPMANRMTVSDRDRNLPFYAETTA